jgi:tetraacyldisaccharide 4'-kinase
MQSYIKSNLVRKSELMHRWLQEQWAIFSYWHMVLLPISWLFGLITSLRRFFYKVHLLKSYRLAVPVIVVGNINVGGTGKTPLVIWLAEQLKIAGYSPGIISRGYGGMAGDAVHVSVSQNPALVGDEPVLIANRTHCPVFVSPNRIHAGQSLLQQFPTCNVIISDDGLQHYRMQRDVEIVVYDATMAFGNGALLPAGPLRETRSRLSTVDVVVSNGLSEYEPIVKNAFSMQLVADSFYNLSQPLQKASAADFSGKKIFAIAGIGNPQRFFNQLEQLGLQFESRAFIDHYQYQPEDFAEIDADIVLMTEKDAVKCKCFARDNFWVLPVHAMFKDNLMPTILNKLNK